MPLHQSNQVKTPFLGLQVVHCAFWQNWLIQDHQQNAIIEVVFETRFTA